ncbi:MAG: Bug family tripartite tricarboxylate transporter substrate binding protein [Burkholderiales bacterium]
MGRLVALIAVALVGAAPISANAQQYPDRPVRIVNPWAPGGTADIFARALAEKLTHSFGQPYLVENRPGASGNIGSDLVAKAKPDGYTLLVGTMSTHAMNQTLFKSMPFHGVDDFTVIAIPGLATNSLVVHPSVPVSNVKELVAYLKANPGKVAYASAGMGSNNHVSAALFERMAGVQMVHVPYKGGAPAVADTVGGQTQLFFTALTQSLPHVRAGRLKLLGVTEGRRADVVPDTPTVSEAVPGYVVEVWYGLFGPANMPPALVARLNAEANRIMVLPDVKDRMDKMGVVHIHATPAEAAQTLRRDAEKWGKIIREMGIVAEP